MAKKHSSAPFWVILIGFLVGFLFGRGLEWSFDDDYDEDEV